MSALISQLVRDRDTGQLCIMVKSGGWSAVLPLPVGLKGAGGELIKAYMDRVVPEMIKGIRGQRAEELRAIRRKAKRA